MRGGFKRYELVDRIGVGGMAEVYRANGVRADGQVVPVVVKKILPSLSSDEGFRQMFVDEARITSLLDHPNVVRMIDLGRMDDQLFLALELVDGTDLQRVLTALEAQKKRLPIPDSIYVISRVLEALEHAHTRTLPDGKAVAIVHRDVSPGNVMIARDGSVKLTDFGIAKGAVRGGHTMVGAVKGNLRYIAPEQIAGGAVGPWSDVYAAGMVLFRMIVGRYPMEFDALGTLVGMIVEGQVPEPREIDPTIPTELDAIVSKAIAFDPPVRYGRARDFQEALERWAREARLSLSPQGVGASVRVLLGAPARPVRTEMVTVVEVEGDTGGQTVFKSVLPQAAAAPPANPFEPEIVEADVVDVTRKSIVRRPRPTKEITEDHTTTDEVRPAFARGLDGDDSADFPVVRGTAGGMGTSDFVIPDDVPVLSTGEVEMRLRHGNTSISPSPPERPDETDRTKPGGIPKTPAPTQREEVSQDVPNLARGDDDARRPWEPDLDAFGTPAKPAASPEPEPEPEPDDAAPLASTTDSFAIPVVATPPPPSVAPPPPGAAGLEEDEHTRPTPIPSREDASVTAKSATAHPGAPAPTPPPLPRTPPAPPPATARAGGTMAIGGFMGHRDTVASISIAPSARFVATGSHDQTVRIWDPATRREVRNLQGHEAAVTAVAVSPDGRFVASVGRDRTLRIWDPFAGNEAFVLNGHDDWIFSVAWSHDSKLLVTCGADRTVRVWNANERRQLFSSEGHGGVVTQVRFLPPWKKQVLSASYDSTLRAWNLSNGAAARRLSHPSMESVRALAVSPEGAYAFSGGADCHVRVWDLSTGTMDSMQGHTGPVVALATPDGNVLGSGSHDGTVKIWDVSARRELKTLRGHRGSVMALAFSPDGKYLLSGGDDRIVAIWQLGL